MSRENKGASMLVDGQEAAVGLGALRGWGARHPVRPKPEKHPRSTALKNGKLRLWPSVSQAVRTTVVVTRAEEKMEEAPAPKAALVASWHRHA